jgi:hypothetical protein
MILLSASGAFMLRHWGGAEMTIVLGMNVLRRLHMYIAYGERTLYVTPATAH